MTTSLSRLLPLFSILVVLMTSTLYAKAEQTLHVGHMLYGSIDANAKDIKVTLGLWTKELGDHVGVPIESHFYDSVESLHQDFAEGVLDYVLIKPLDLIRCFDIKEHTIGFSPVRDDDSIHNTLVILVKDDSGIRDVQDLKGKRLGISKDDEIGGIYLDVQLMQEGLPKRQECFSKISTEKKRSKVLLDLFFDRIDVAVVTKGTLMMANEMNPQVGKALHILQEQTIQMGMVSIFHKDIDPAILERFERSIKTLNENARAKQILLLFKADRLQRFSMRDIEELRTLYHRYQSLQGKEEPATGRKVSHARAKEEDVTG